MEDKIRFKNILNEIENKAKEQGGTIEVSQIQDYVSEMSLEDDHKKLLYDFIVSKNIVITGYEPLEEINTVKKELTKEENDFLDDYLETVKGTASIEEEEGSRLYPLILEGDSLAKSRLTEGMLKEIVSIAKEYGGQGIAIGDLIQEGNIGLLLVVEELEDKKELKDFQDMKAYLEKKIRGSIMEIMKEQETIEQSNLRMLERINNINDSAKDLKEDLGRNVTLEEIAQYTKKTPEEIRDILRLTLDELPIEE